jgi:DNA-binding beta-propeller fold protein YncE
VKRKSLSCSIAALAIVLIVGQAAQVSAALLVVDRLNNTVYRYSNSGALVNTVITDNANLSQPAGIALSPDLSKLYVSSTLNNRVMQYDYNAVTGSASNPTIFADGADGLAFPNQVLFNPAGNRVYVSNLGGSGVAQFNLDGSSAGAPVNGVIGGGAFFQYSGMAFAPSGELIVGAYKDFPGGTQGAVAKSNAGITSLNNFIAGTTALEGLTGMLVQGFNLYVAAGDAGNVRRYNVSTGELDAGFGLSGLEFPQGLANAPDGNGMIVGILTNTNGAGYIARYDFNGALLGTFAPNGGGGFSEPTAFTFAVPEPAGLSLIAAASAMLLSVVRRRRTA